SAAVLARVERGSRGLCDAIRELAAHALAEHRLAGAARRGAAPGGRARGNLGTRRASRRPLALDAGRPALRRSAERGRADRPLYRAAASRLWLAPGAHRDQVEIRRCRGFPIAAAYTPELPVRD